MKTWVKPLCVSSEETSLLADKRGNCEPTWEGSSWWHSAGVDTWKEKSPENREESQRGESDNENAVRVKTAGESDDKKRPVEWKHSAGESDNAEVRVWEKHGIAPCITHTIIVSVTHTSGPADTPHTETPAGCLMFKSVGRRIWKLCSAEMRNRLFNGHDDDYFPSFPFPLRKNPPVYGVVMTQCGFC